MKMALIFLCNFIHKSVSFDKNELFFFPCCKAGMFFLRFQIIQELPYIGYGCCIGGF